MSILLKAKQDLVKSLSSPPPGIWKHQQETLNFSIDKPAVFDTSDPGIGKTRSHIEVFTKRYADKRSESLLVVCPKSLMEAAWVADIKKFAPHLSVSLAFAENREAAFDLRVPVYIINADGVKFLAKKPETWFRQKFGKNPTLIVDESTNFKNPQSQRSKAIRTIAPYFTYRTNLSGTVMPNSATELWNQAYILDLGQRLGKQYIKFRNAIQVPINRGMFTEWQDREDAVDIVYAALRDITIRHEFDKVMDIPENFTRTLDVHLPPKLMQAYEELREEAIIMLQDAKVSAVNAAVHANKLLQLASGAVYYDTGKYKVVDTQRYELVADLIEEREHSVVFYNWGHQLDQMVDLLDKRKTHYAVINGSVTARSRRDIVEAYQRGDYQTLLLHPQTGAHGLTLTRGRTTIWASPRYEADLMKQGIHRVYRGGQTHRTENILIQATGTIEPAVYERLNQKAENMNSLLELLRG